MGKLIAAAWRKVVGWLAVLGSAHVVDDGTEVKDKPTKNGRAILHLVSNRI